MRELEALISGARDDVPLEVAALELASVEYPELQIEPYRMILDSHAAELGARVRTPCSGEDFVHALREYLADELGFTGNHDDYYIATNSCLNEVLTQRVGLPITLSIVYMEIARRLGRRIEGIGLPGHFVCRYTDEQFSVYIDPFNGGQLLFAPECYDLAKRVTGLDYTHDPSVLKPVSKRQMAVRMLANLRTLYFQTEQHSKALRVMDLLVTATPGTPEVYKQRAVCNIQLERVKAARHDLETYIRLAPDAPDIEEVVGYVKRMTRILSQVN